MSHGIIGIIIGLSFLGLLATGFSIAFAMLTIATVGYLVFVGPEALHAIFPLAFNIITTDIFIAVPLFIFMANVFEVSGIGGRMYDAMYKWMAGLRGGLAIGTVLICTLIAAITGLAATGTVIGGLLAYPEMKKRGYDKMISIGPIMAGGALGPLIPPSVPMIIVSCLTTVSAGKLFMAGVFPGIICSLLFCLYIGIKCLYNKNLAPPIPIAERANWKEKINSLWGLLPPILLIFLVLGGIYLGVCTPSEAGGVGSAGALICAIACRNLTCRKLLMATMNTFRVNAMVMWLAIGGSAFASLTGITGINRGVSNFLGSLSMSPNGIVLVMLGIVFILGMFIDIIAIVMICLPIMMPVIIQIGFDPLFFAFLFTMCLIIGILTPPFGYNLFYFKGLGYEEVSMMDIYRSVTPYIVLMTIAMILCLLFPQIPLWLPNKMIK